MLRHTLQGKDGMAEDGLEEAIRGALWCPFGHLVVSGDQMIGFDSSGML